MVASMIVTSIGCLLLAFISGWKLALVILAFLPFLFLSAWVRSKVYFTASVKEKTTEESGKVMKYKYLLIGKFISICLRIIFLYQDD